jgi:iron complex transport system ATP-binding protein
VVALGRLPHGEEGRDAVERAVQACRIGALRERDATSLSGGEHMRMMLARLLAGEPRYMLVDEATAALDPYHQLLVMELLREAAVKGAGIVAVLHDLGLAARFCDRLQLLDQGRTIAVGGPDQVLTQQLLNQVYRVSGIVQTVAGQRIVQILDRIGDG